MAHRLWPIDVTRGLAVVLMACYHFLFDLNYLGFASLDFQNPLLVIFQRLIAFLFLSLVGVSLVLARENGLTVWQNVKRVSFLSAVALLITAATFVYPGPQNGLIVFGIIHFIALAVLLGYFFTRLPPWANLLAGGLVALAGFWLSALSPASTPWLLWLGLPPSGFYSLDYYPLIPWFGIVLFGIAIGKSTAPFLKQMAQQSLPNPLAVFDYLGKHALAIYLVHQPVLFGLLWIGKSVFGH